jgi:hypothetical protein
MMWINVVSQKYNFCIVLLVYNRCAMRCRCTPPIMVTLIIELVGIATFVAMEVL